MTSELLFYNYDLNQILRMRISEIKTVISSCDSSVFLKSDINDLVNEYKDHFYIPNLLLHEEKISIIPEDVDIDVSQDSSRFIPDRTRPFFLKGLRITYCIPFTGDPTLFHSKPSTFDFNPPRGIVTDNEVLLIYQGADLTKETLKTEFSRKLADLKKYVSWINHDLDEYNRPLESNILNMLEERKRIVQKNQSLVSDLEFPLRQSVAQEKSYTVPVSKKKIISRMVSDKSSLPPEPVLDQQIYEDILDVITSMAFVMERNPQSFATLDEEAIRDHFLVPLNAQFSGEATGETFNHQGKTDILIRHKDNNIFIAECKFWGGEQLLLETIDQLLRYTSWRDTKTAILIFNRNMNFSKVVGEIPNIVKKHPNFVTTDNIKGETNSRFILHNNNDIERKIILSVLPFNIPKRS